ncbi:MAG TPA: hypothetical protein VJV79_11465, partial [Polyangiaceae bacterium]|nr:hypothetical protein [Polyangiaceae bacterium]
AMAGAAPGGGAGAGGVLTGIAGSGSFGGMSASGGVSTSGSAGTGGSVSPLDPICPYQAGKEPSGGDWVNGKMLEFSDNGGWCWYQDERVIVDQQSGQLIIGSVASGGARDKHVEATHWDLATSTGKRHHLGTMTYTDDHDVQALVQRPGGGYVAMWAGHNDDCNSYYSVYEDGAWSKSAAFAWPECPSPSGKKITYANLWYLGDTIYSYVRSIDTSPNYLASTDGGKSWKLGGRLTSTPQVGYVAGYYKYWGNNQDRLDFLGTEAHPRDNDNSLYHGYIKDGKIHDSTGVVIDDDFTDRSAQNVTKYTQVIKAGTTIKGARLEHFWNADLVRYDDGTLAALGTARVAGSGSTDPDKRLLYFRFDGSKWTTTYLVKAGNKLYSSEQDYTGLGALHPDNPRVIYISTPFDPRTDEGKVDGKKEIWKGVTCDGGATFEWEPVTANSQEDNLRPVIPKWDAKHTALLWLRGTYSTAQSYRLKIVGLLEDR